MTFARSVGVNVSGGRLWLGLLILFTTPWYVSLLGFEGYGFIGFWQLLLYSALVLAFGLSAALPREFAIYTAAGSQMAERAIY